MPFDGSGNFQRLMNWVNDAAANIKIRADRHDTEDDNLASGLSQTLTKDGQSLPTNNIQLNNKRLINVADPANPQDAVTKNYLDTQLTTQNLTFVAQQVITTTGAITLDPKTKAFLIEVQGGGGGGGSSGPSTAASQGSAGSGGAAGGYVSKWKLRPTGSYSPACTIGAGAAMGTVGNGSQFVDGTDTLTGGGGGAGGAGIATASQVSISGGGGGAATGGDINVIGGAGGASIVVAGASTMARSGKGANSRFGNGGIALGVTTSIGTGANGSPGGGRGSGGSGGYTVNSGGLWNAGAGGAGGMVVITEFR